MKIYMIHDTSNGERDSDVYSTVPVCESCIEELEGSEFLISYGGDYDPKNPNYGDRCNFCYKTYEQEKEEQN